MLWVAQPLVRAHVLTPVTMNATVRAIPDVIQPARVDVIGNVILYVLTVAIEIALQIVLVGVVLAVADQVG